MRDGRSCTHEICGRYKKALAKSSSIRYNRCVHVDGDGTGSAPTASQGMVEAWQDARRMQITPE